MSRHPLFSVGVRVNGRLRDVPTDLPTDAFFPIYSITKTLTAICVLRLVEHGVFGLDDPITAHVTDVDLPKAITLTHLLRHTSGLRDYGPLKVYHDAVRAHAGVPWTRQQFLDSVVPAGLHFPPGETFSYSNPGYMLLIDAIERVSGLSFAKAIDRFVVKPLALRRTMTLETIDDLLACEPGFGRGVTPDDRVVDVRGIYHPGWCAPRLVGSTVEEVTLIFDVLLGGRLLAPDSLDRMLTLIDLDASSPPGTDIGGGMGLYSDRNNTNGRNFHHGGGGPGWDLSVTTFMDLPIGRTTVAIFANSCDQPRAASHHEAAILESLR
ncbi:MAG TPA: serine hydrolase domain-containing protein [Vicinamibacterales bacterium]|nr:serine hydrolase domain-containing protein [Vicinamibacterales bacterium]